MATGDNKNQTSGQQVSPVQQESSPAKNEVVKPTILIVEDDPVLCRMYEEKFKSEGFNVLIATDGRVGLDKALNEKINLILLDVMLPRMSGIDLLDHLRKDAKAGKTKVR